MAKKSKQRVQQKLTTFQRIWNDSDATPAQKQAAADHFGDGPGPANGQSDSSERRPRKMKGVGLLVILFIALLALLIWHRATMKKDQPVLATQTTVTDTVKIIEEEITIPPQTQQPEQPQPKVKDEVKEEVFETSTSSVKSPQPKEKEEPKPVNDDKATTAPTKPVFPTSGRKEDLDRYMNDYREWLIYQRRQERPDLYD